ncbi:hypothetical protein AB0N17_13160 [Streptomyces sp. NPDC051133]|uniref:hypothetical protein n=1 Tax=Streptomyces sp. NPDC051133 TaxID=3155521 RepID=UPI0034124CAC
MKRVLVGFVTAGVFLAGAGTAVASSWRNLPAQSTTGVAFTGQYRVNPPERNHGSFEWKGQLQDTDPGDGHNGYVEVKVEGHGWIRYYGKQRKSVFMHHSNWDGAERYIEDARFHVCRDKGALRPDNCASELRFSYKLNG